MSDATRAIALTEAVKISQASGNLAGSEVLALAESFHAFMSADSPVLRGSIPGAEPPKPAPTDKTTAGGVSGAVAAAQKTAAASAKPTPPKPAATATAPKVTPAKPTVIPAVKPKPLVDKSAKKPPAKTEEQLAAEALAAAEAEKAAADAAEAAGDTDTPQAWTAETAKQAVGDVVAALIAGDKRDAAVELLGKYGATSVSKVTFEDAEAFVAEANELLNPDGDITA